MLNTPDQINYDLDGHGERPFGYRVEFASDKNATEFGTPWGPWTVRECSLDKVDLGYGADDYTATLRMWDPDSVEAPHLTGLERDTLMQKPRNGEIIRIWHFDNDTGPDGRLIFRGAIRSVHDSKSGDGVEWVVEAVSEVVRLNELHVTFSANLRNDPNNPSPRFDGNGRLQPVEARLKTVAELIREVMDFPDAWGRPQFWRYVDVRWADTGGGKTLETDPRCGLFTPTNVVFTDTPKGEAIAQILQAAGNYTFIYQPEPEGDDKIMIVELNQKCNRCGDLWDIPFASTDQLDVQLANNYASDFFIKTDSTTWTSKQTANLCRITGGQIRFYSGNHIIPERLEPFTPDGNKADTENIVDYTASKPNNSPLKYLNNYNDSPDDQRDHSINTELGYYRFTNKKSVNGVADARKPGSRYCVVGAPMFPDWNIHEEYIPQLIQIGTIKAQGTLPNGMTEENYRGLAEWGYRLSGDLTSSGAIYLNRTNNLRAYQAWFAEEKCPACLGTGLVKKVYNNTENEPEFDFYAVGPSGSRLLTGFNWTIKKNEMVDARVKNYLMPPKKFGEINPSTGKHYHPGDFGLEPFLEQDEQPTEYPLPWKNLCPYCRGVGMKPEHKIRYVQNQLFAGRNNQVPGVGEGNPEVPTDADATATGPETWDQSVNRMMLPQSYFVQVEEHWNYMLPTFDKRNKNFDDLERDLAAARKANVNDPNAGLNKFKHPLAFTKLKKILPQRFGLTDAAQTQIAEPTWSCFVPFTSVSMRAPDHSLDATMGRIIFKQPIFIPCRKQFKTYSTREIDHQTSHVVATNGTLVVDPKVGSTARASSFPTGYWRPARVWMSFFYVRPNYYAQMLKDADGNKVDPVEVELETAEGEIEQYIARSIIIDGRYAIEVIKKNPDTDISGATEFSTGNRIMQVAVSDENLIFETYPSDMWKLPVPPTTRTMSQEIDDDELLKLPFAKGLPVETLKKTESYLEAYKVKQKLDYPRGRLLRWDTATPGELQREADGYVSADFDRNVLRPKVFSFQLRDNRVKQLEVGIKKLEAQNNISVNGAMTLVGKSNDLSRGLGWVDYPDKAPAAVVRLTYDYSNGFETTLELSVERARQGELPPTAAEQANQVVKDIADLKRTIYMADGRLNPALAAGADQSGDTATSRSGDSGAEDGNGSRGKFRLFVR